MGKNPFAPEFKNLPETIPVFPLTGVLLLPHGTLPLNIFEPCYVQMIDDALATKNKLIGMVQSKPDTSLDQPEIYQMGCAGRITDYSETSDGRYLINLTGISRFEISDELSVTTLYRQVKPNWQPFEDDVSASDCLGLNRPKLKELLKCYFQQEGLSCDWDMVDQAGDEKLITCLAMVCPFEPGEKQALLEASTCKGRAELFMTMLEMATKNQSSEDCSGSYH